ncbi:MAG: hypothetical protein LBT46_05575 [Planctomycetaceae bacterium]|nr:hypothetical protein [Planctomycetaceae bacterium]
MKYSGYAASTNSFNGVHFNGTGTWYWLVQAYDVNDSVIAKSATRSCFTVSAAGTQSLASPNVSAVNSQPAAFADTSELSEQIEELEYETLYGEYEELLNLYFGL